MSTQAVLTSFIVLLSILWCILTFVKSRKEKASLPPGPRGLPIIGYLPFLGTNLHNEFAELARRYGPVYKMQLGNKLCVILSAPSVVKEVARDQDAVFSNRDPPIAALVATYGGLDIAWSPNGSYWRNMRKIFSREMLSRTNIDATHDFRKDEVRKAIKHVSTKVGMPIDIGELTFQTELNVIMNMLWGNTIQADKPSKVGAEFRELLVKMIDLFSRPNISDFFPILARFDIQGIEKEMKIILQSFDNILEYGINERMKIIPTKVADEINKGRRRDFIQILLELGKHEDISMQINRTQIKAILMDIVTGGTDTTATMAEWVMAEVVHHKEVLLKVQKELEDVIGVHSIVEEFHLPKLQYLEAVIKETFRLHPALPLLLPKRPSQSCTIGGYTIPKDTKIFVNAWAIHRDPQLWDNPLDFMPERFLSDPSKWDFGGNNFQYLPFGSGRRVCVGLPIAERMLKHLLASLLHSFNWQATESKELDLSEKFGVVMRKSKPLLAIPNRRLPCLDLYA